MINGSLFFSLLLFRYCGKLAYGEAELGYSDEPISLDFLETLFCPLDISDLMSFVVKGKTSLLLLRPRQSNEREGSWVKVWAVRPVPREPKQRLT